jgi:hypothetical protein
MATTQNTFTGDGSNLGPFSFTFKWLESTDIKVTVAGVLKTAGTHYNLQGLNYTTKTGGQVLFTAGNAPANGAAIVVYRQTDDSDLAATFYSGSAIRAQDLNNNFIQGLYVTQESNNVAASATSTANTALTNSNTAISTANGAVSTANTASTNASAAVATANTANTNASAAVSTANTANTNATAAVNTANTASSNASTALSTANTALSTANTASTNATTAISTANTASTNASAAVSTANTAASNASAAVSTANTASSNASTALSTANTAISTANAAASAVANAILYDIVANVAAIPASPANNDAVEVTDSTGIQSFTPLTGVPAGFVGSSGLSVRLVYTTTGSTWNWIQYFPNDPETRYLKLAGGTLTGDLTVANQGDIRFGEATANGSNYVAIQAPSSLAANVTYTLPSADGTSGQLLSTDGTGTLSWATASGGSSVTTSDTPPATPNDGDLWYDSVGGRTYVYYQDPNGSQWVDAAPQGGGSSTSITTGNTTAEVIDTGSNGRFVVTTEGTEALRVDASRRLLVGTSTSVANLYRATTASIAPTIQLENVTNSYNTGFSSLNYSAGGFAPVVTLGLSKSNTQGTSTVVASGDELGYLQFVGADGTNFRTAAWIRGEVDGTPGANDMPGRLVFSTTADGASTPTERARITSAGASWATTTGSYRYQAATCHEFTVNNNGEYALFISNTNSTSPLGVVVKYDTDINNTANTPFKFQGGTTDRFVVRSNGGLANYQANDVNLSDINAKKDISPAAGTWDCLKQWEIVNYRYKDQPDDADLNLGVIAQQVAESCPEVITVFEEATEDQPEKLGIKEQQMYWMAIKALQEAQVRIEALEAENASQAAAIAAVEARLTALEGGTN